MVANRHGTALRAVIVGGGIGGLAAAVALTRRGIDVRSKGRLTLLGDAAHAMLPHLGQGMNQAIEDAAALAMLLDGAGRDDVPTALTAYEALRRDRTARVQHASRLDGTSYDSSGARLQDHSWIYDYDVAADAAARS
jgi:salicylate hydroxylase